MPEWSQYGCVAPTASKAFGQKVGSKLTELSHIAHVPDSLRYLSEGRIPQTLVYDESRLNTTRTTVVWLSPNNWAAGSIYGTVSFVYDWETLVAGRSIYWVEDIRRYNPPAYRFYLSANDVSHLTNLTPYDPTADDGPLLQVGGDWFWNGNFTAEFMVDGALPLSDLARLDFVTHHSDICRLKHSPCREKGTVQVTAGARTMASLVGLGLHSIDHVLKRPDAVDKLICPADYGVGHWALLFGERKVGYGGPIKDPAVAKAVVKAALILHGSGDTDGARDILSSLSNDSLFEAAANELIADHFGLPSYSMVG